uniref:Uncharacterized protein n=1 Tax=Nelumbo nucifera TaxID=4432 RepID=A0A822YKQ3_NELNU|nr:TPA_asm: hypothetical protein HUJ06_010406 [Nelumbo nucifera]
MIGVLLLQVIHFFSRSLMTISMGNCRGKRRRWINSSKFRSAFVRPGNWVGRVGFGLDQGISG